MAPPRTADNVVRSRLLTSLQLAKEYAFTGERICAQRAAQIGLGNHVVPDDQVLDSALDCARRLLRVPNQALLDTKRVLNNNLERAMRNVVDFASASEERSFTSSETRSFFDRTLEKK
jgi:enoyl-CoA hydratase